MTDREIMQQALEALIKAHPYSNSNKDLDGHSEAITALRERLAQPEQEPVVWVLPKMHPVMEFRRARRRAADEASHALARPSSDPEWRVTRAIGVVGAAGAAVWCGAARLGCPGNEGGAHVHAAAVAVPSAQLLPPRITPPGCLKNSHPSGCWSSAMS